MSYNSRHTGVEIDDAIDKLKNELSIKDGGTGSNNVENARENLNVYSKQEVDSKIPDVSTYMTKNNPTGTGSLSLNRKADTIVGDNSIAIGNNTTASGAMSHAEGYESVASGNSSHAEGYYTKASGNYSHVQGKYNIEDTTGTYAHIIGNGASESERSNAHTVDWGGNAWYAGNVTVGSDAKILATTDLIPTALTDEEIAAICDFDGEIESDVIPIATKAALGCVVAGNGLSITEDGILSLENDITPITKGGTGANNAAIARQNINYIGVNPIASIEEDTPANWVALGTGIAYINVTGQLIDQPTRFLMIHNMVGYANTVHQIAFQDRLGGIWHRGGNISSGWRESWTRMLDENYVPDILSIYNSAEKVFSTTKSVIAFDKVRYSTTDKLGMSNNGIKILSDKVSKIKVSALLRLNPNSTSTCGIYVYVCKNGTDLTNFSSIAYSGISVALSIVDYYIDVQKDDIITFKMLGSVANTARLQAGSPFTVEVIE